MAEPLTAADIRAVAGKLRDQFLVMGHDCDDVDFGHGSDISEPLADLLAGMAGAIEVLEQTGYRDGTDGHDLVIPELRALVRAIREAS